ncbi:RWD domain-containing protein 1 [Hyalella azteca]|uniref:RWD domain-containing protein 1 n=1 Tax=Hyalella azteca TaxID=294128 RepID=A0A8B7PET9_HYAAZ|nr:RWD domain-containing protein 1 [Hyalella azteca]
MTDYKEEQNNEVEALESIYPDEFQREYDKVFEGTRVTVETFMTWKAKFDAEMAALKSSTDISIDGKKRLTGKELFLADKTLNESDLSFLGEGDTAVAVDETLFENLDDLELDDDDEDDDPDYKP